MLHSDFNCFLGIGCRCCNRSTSLCNRSNHEQLQTNTKVLCRCRLQQNQFFLCKFVYPTQMQKRENNTLGYMDLQTLRRALYVVWVFMRGSRNETCPDVRLLLLERLCINCFEVCKQI